MLFRWNFRIGSGSIKSAVPNVFIKTAIPLNIHAYSGRSLKANNLRAGESLPHKNLVIYFLYCISSFHKLQTNIEVVGDVKCKKFDFL